MNEIVRPRASTATAALVGLNAALAVSGADWPSYQPSYATSQNISTFSFFETGISTQQRSSSQEFAEEITTVFAALSEGQEPLGSEFETVWDDNLDSLYQS